MHLRQPRIFYVGMVVTCAYVKVIRRDVFVGAASSKMSAVVSALRLAGRRALMVSLPFVGQEVERQPGCLCRGDGFPAMFLPARESPAARKAFGFFSLAWFAMKRVRRGDTILFYNHAVEYLLALLILRIRGISVFQDIEDVPISADRGIRGLLNRLGFDLMFKLSSDRKVTVSSQVGNALNIRDFIAIQGVAAEAVITGRDEIWAQLKAGAPLRVHYGGTLMASTGFGLFCEAIAHLDGIVQTIGRRIEFIVTGIGDLSRLQELMGALRSEWLRIEIHQGVTKADYLDLFDSCHASLSLRCPESEISSTTFPSKVIEIASRGLALVTTPVSDIVDIFSDDDAWLLPEFCTQALCDILRDMARNPAEVHRRADAGQALVQTRFAPLTVGQALAEFLEMGPK